MSFLFRRRYLILLFILIVLLPILAFFVWRGLTITSITELWTQPENRTGILINFAAALAYGLVVSIFLLFRQIIFGLTKTAFFPGYREAEKERIIQERLYLDNLIDRFKQELPWEVMKYSSLEAIQEVRRIQVKLWHVPDTGETRIEGSPGSRVDLLAFLRREKKPVMVKGDPGTGKTLTMRRLAVDQAQALKKSLKAEKIPLYIFLGFYTGKTMDGQPESIFDFLQHYLQEEFPAAAFLREHLTEYLTQGRFLLLFDGLNELPPDEYMARYTKLEEFVFLKYPRNKAIFTCRTLRYTSTSKFHTVAISNLDNDQIKRFIAAYLGSADAENLYRELASGDGFMLRICRNPFMLRMLVSREASRPVPQSPAQLFEEYVHDSLATISQSTAETTDILREVAFLMQKKGNFASVVSLQWLQVELPHLSSDTLEKHIETAYRSKLVDYTSERKIRFYHQILQEYFAATALQKEWQSGKSMEEYFTDYRWEDTVLVSAGIVQNSEQFISQIWSPEKNEPEAFWLATKAVGTSGMHTGTPYYKALLSEAEAYLDRRRRGYARTVLAVDTIKALSYIDDDNTARLLQDTLINQTGWIRELSIQTLGDSRNDTARKLLRSTVIKLRSIPALLLVSPYFSRQEWLRMVVSSSLSLGIITSAFWQILRYLWILTPGLYLGLIYLGAQLFNTDPIALVARMGALTILVQCLSSCISRAVPVIRSQDTTKEKFADLKDILLKSTPIILFAAILWLFSGEMNAVLSIVCILLWYIVIEGLVVAVLFNFLRPLRVIHLFYSKAARGALFSVVLISFGLFIFFLLPSTWNIPSIHVTPHVGSAVENAIWYLFGLLTTGLLIGIVFYSMIVIAILSIIVHCVTGILYWRLWKNQRAFMKKGDEQAVVRILKTALSSSSWFHVRSRAFKELRLVNVPFRYVRELDDLLESNKLYDQIDDNIFMTVFGDELDLKGELERTVYELLARAREEERENPSEEYILALWNRGKMRYQAGYYQEALTYLNRALTLRPKNVSALLTRGQVYRAMKRLPEAIADFSEVIVNESQNTVALAYRGLACSDEGRYARAIDDFTQAISFGERSAWVFAERAYAYQCLQCYAEALADFDQAITLEEQVDWYFEYRGSVHFHLASYVEALADFDQAIALNGSNARLLLQRGRTYRDMQRYTEAKADFDQAVTLDQANSLVYYNRGLLSLLNGQVEDFKQDLTKAIELETRYQKITTYHLARKDSNFLLALYYLAEGNIADAQIQYDHSIEDCGSADVLHNALLYLEDFLKVQPGNALAQDLLSRLQDRWIKVKKTLE